MFGSKKEKPNKEVTAKSSSRNIIDKGTKIIGDIVSEGDFRIDGVLEGTLKTEGRVIIGKEGNIKGKIECNNADVEGTFNGEFVVNNTLTAKSTSTIIGDVIVGQISTESGATFNANCSMRSKQVEKSDKKTSKNK